MPPSEHVRGPGAGVLGAAAVLGGLAVAAGALGAHYLKDQLGPQQLDTWATAAQYQMYHALALLVVARLISRRSTPLLRAAVWFFVLGIVLFSGSLYALALTGETWLGYFTPAGGVALVAGWGCFAVSSMRARG